MLLRRCARLSQWRPLSTRPQEVATTEKMEMVRPSVTKWKRPPFVKGFFQGKFDTELLAFPEILNPDELAELESHVSKVNHLMQHNVDSRHVDETQEIPHSVLESLKDMGLFGRTIPAKYGGLDLTHTASTRLNEVLGLDWSLSSTLAAHEFFATQVILQFGSEEQKSKYLPRLASGELIAALCCTELQSGSDLLSLESRVSDTPSILSGTKCWVANAQRAGLFIVIARTPSIQNPEETSVFLVEREAEGVKVTPQHITGLRGLATGIVHFDEVSIQPSNVIGSYGNGFKVFLKALESFRIASSSMTFGALKALFGSVAGNVTQRERGSRSLADYEQVRVRLSRVQSRIYGLESAAYLAAAILDSTDQPDMALEAGALKVLCSEYTMWCLDELGVALGSCSLVPGSQLERMARDARVLQHMDSPADMCLLFVGLSGIREVGLQKEVAIRTLRNPLVYPKDMTLRWIRFWKMKRGFFSLPHDIAGHIHPSLTEWGNQLEKNVQLFEVAVEEVLVMGGRGVAEQQTEPIRLARVAAELFAWAAVLSRTSRSYCIGLPNSHHELRLAEAYCFDADVRIKIILSEVLKGVVLCNDRNHMLLGEQCIDVQGYFPAHPLAHNL